MARKSNSAIWRYGLALLAYIVPLAIALTLQHFSIKLDLSLLLVGAIIVATWYGGKGPGFLTTALFELTTYGNAILTHTVTTAQLHSWRFAFLAINRLALLAILVFLVSGRRKAESRLREQREWLEVTLSSIGDAVIATDLNGRVTFMNPTAETLTGWPAEQATGRPLDEIFNITNEQTSEKVENPVAKVIREGTIVGLANHTILVSRNGARRPIDDSGAPIRSLDGRITGVVLVFRDVTERNQAEEVRELLLGREKEARAQAEKASRIKDEFLATVSHELRTPLTAVLGWSKILKEGRLDQVATRRAIEVIDRNASAQVELVNDLLDMSRIISGKMRLEIRSTELSGVIKTAVETLRPAAEAKGISLELKIQFPSVVIKGDADRLQQIVWNLLSNAIRFTGQGGRVEVRLERTDSSVDLIVRDTGIGIKQEFLPHVFDRFQQADSSITRTYGGLGLGLAIVRNLVELHGGIVKAESEGEGQGTTFTAQFPLGATQELDSPIAKASLIDSHWTVVSPTGLDQRPNLAGLRVLVVDDEVDALDLISVVLTQYGAEVRTAGSTSAAMELLTEWRPNVLLSDIGMPDEDGYALIRRVRSLSPELGGRTPAAALTAFARREDRQRAISAGYQIHVTKPVDPKEIAAVVSSLANQI